MSYLAYLINLDRSPDRLKCMAAQLNSLDIPYTRITGVDGSSIGTGVNAEVARSALPPHAIGCAMSHYSAYRRMLADGAEVAFVMEDDLVFCPDFKEVLSLAARAINDTDVFLLYFHGRDKKRFSSQGAIRVSATRSFHRGCTMWGPYSAGAYLIHRNVARRLASYILPVRVTADNWFTFHADGVIGGLWGLLPLAIAPGKFGSDIGYSPLGRAVRSLEKSLVFSFPLRMGRKMLRPTRQIFELVEDAPDWV